MASTGVPRARRARAYRKKKLSRWNDRPGMTVLEAATTCADGSRSFTVSYVRLVSVASAVQSPS